MPNALNYPDEERARLHNGINEVLQSLQASKKRKRATPDRNGIEEGSQPNGAITMNGNGETAHGAQEHSFVDPMHETTANSNNEFSNLSQQLAQHNSSTDSGEGNNGVSSTAAAALAAQLSGSRPTDMSFMSANSGTDGEQQIDSSFDMGNGNNQNRHTQGTPYNLAPFTSPGGTAEQVQAAREGSNGGGVKPPVGSDEWHKVRRDNHKEVERRRRETINEGINEIAKIVPGCEKNKGSILQRAVNYIVQLKTDNEKAAKAWNLEKIIMEQAVSEVGTRNENLSKEVKDAWAEEERSRKRVERLESQLRKAGVEPEVDTEMANGEGTS